MYGLKCFMYSSILTVTHVCDKQLSRQQTSCFHTTEATINATVMLYVIFITYYVNYKPNGHLLVLWGSNAKACFTIFCLWYISSQYSPCKIRTTQELKKFYFCDVMRCDTHPNYELLAMMQNIQIIVNPPLSIISCELCEWQTPWLCWLGH